jgi:hypothetical protein
MRSKPLFFGIALAVAAFAGATNGARADIVRHCAGFIAASIKGGVNANGQPFVQGQSAATSAVNLNGRGTCRSTAYANDCRRRARDAIISCAVGIWAERWTRRVPTSVCESADNGRPPHAGVTRWGAPGVPSSVRATLTNDVKRALEHTACCVLNPTARRLSFDVDLYVNGDARCPHIRDLIGQPYEANCRQLRNQGLCG